MKRELGQRVLLEADPYAFGVGATVLGKLTHHFMGKTLYRWRISPAGPRSLDGLPDRDGGH